MKWPFIFLLCLFLDRAIALQHQNASNHAVIKAKINTNITSIIHVNHDRIHNAVSLAGSPTLYIDNLTGILYVNDQHEKRHTLYLSLFTEKERHFTLFLEKSDIIVEPILIHLTKRQKIITKKTKRTIQPFNKERTALATDLTAVLNNQTPQHFIKKPHAHHIIRLPAFAYEVQHVFCDHDHIITVFTITARVKQLNIATVVRSLPFKPILFKASRIHLKQYDPTTLVIIERSHANTV